MKIPHDTRSACAMVLVLALGAGFALAATAPADPWTRVPAAPVSPYANDDFAARAGKTRDQVLAEADRLRTEGNEATSETANIDPMVAAQRMQQFMMDHPEQAAKMMQGVTEQGPELVNRISALGQQQSQLERELDGLIARFKADVDAVDKPVLNRIDAFTKAHGELGEGGYFIPPPYQPQYKALVHERNVAYEGVYAAYVAPNGSFTGWLARYRHCLQELSAAEEAKEGGVNPQLAAMGMSGRPSTAKLDAVRSFIEGQLKVYGVRRGGPIT